jgi:hypothetical protein
VNLGHGRVAQPVILEKEVECAGADCREDSVPHAARSALVAALDGVKDMPVKGLALLERRVCPQAQRARVRPRIRSDSHQHRYTAWNEQKTSRFRSTVRVQSQNPKDR